MSNAESYLTVTGIVVLTIYFLPAIVASARLHRQTMAIVVLDLLLGWTLLGWIAALVGVHGGHEATETSNVNTQSKSADASKTKFREGFPGATARSASTARRWIVRLGIKETPFRQNLARLTASQRPVRGASRCDRASNKESENENVSCCCDACGHHFAGQSSRS